MLSRRAFLKSSLVGIISTFVIRPRLPELNNSYVVDTSSGGITISLPPSPHIIYNIKIQRDIIDEIDTRFGVLYMTKRRIR